MKSYDVHDHIEIGCPIGKAFEYFVSPEHLACWWPKHASVDPQSGGKVELHWFGGGVLKTEFTIFEHTTLIAMPFYDETLEVRFEDKGESTVVHVVHRVPYEEGEIAKIIHVAQSWSFLLANLKSMIEHESDLRSHSSSS